MRITVAPSDVIFLAMQNFHAGDAAANSFGDDAAASVEASANGPRCCPAAPGASAGGGKPFGEAPAALRRSERGADHSRGARCRQAQGDKVMRLCLLIHLSIRTSLNYKRLAEEDSNAHIDTKKEHWRSYEA